CSRHLSRSQAEIPLILAVQFSRASSNGIQFTTPGAGGLAVPLIKEAIDNGERFWAHAPSNTPAPPAISSTARPSRSIQGPTVKSRG
ncbi:hypothetical protein ACC685_35785, partial [Rhizobium ruizarguesonis]